MHRFDYHRRLSAGSRLGPDDLDDGFVAGLDALHLTGITLAVSATSREAAWDVMRRARAVGAVVSLAVNIGPPSAAIRPPSWRQDHADIVFLSDEEAEIVGVPEAPEVVLTSGATGAMVRVAGRETVVAPPTVGTVDAAGAGDALAGAYVASRLAGLDPEAALRRGVVAASLSCRSRGCALSYPSAAEVEAALVA